jgi:hypothetical protein
VGYGPFFLCVIHKQGLCPHSGDINRMMMIVINHGIFLDTHLKEVMDKYKKASNKKNVFK